MEDNQALTPNPQPAPFFPTGKRELVFGVLILFAGWALCNSVLFTNLDLGFALFSTLTILCSTLYLCISGHKLTGYTGSLLLLSLVICGSFARSDDGFVKFVMFCFLIISTNLALTALCSQNRRSVACISSLLDVPRTIFRLGFG